MEILITYAPFLAATVAVILFAFKEASEFRRRRRDRKHNRLLVASMVGEELKRNFIHFHIYSEVFTKHATYSLNKVFASKIHRGSTGKVSCEIHSSEGTALFPLPALSTKYFDLLIGKIAELGPETFKSIRAAYVATQHINQVRDALISAIEDAAPMAGLHDAEDACVSVHNNKQKYLKTFQQAHKELTGEVLEIIDKT